MLAVRHPNKISRRLKHWAALHKDAFSDWRYWVILISILGLAFLRYVLERIGMLYFIGDLYYLPLSLYWVPLTYCAWTFNIPVTVSSVVLVLILNSAYVMLYSEAYFRVFEISQVAISAVMAIFMAILISQKKAEEQKAKIYAKRALDSREDERKKISRDLHDDSIQAMSLVCRQLDSVRYFNKDLPGPVNDELL
jgi:signal transduction histidine kinase